jgi:Small metal-binding protein
MNFKKLWVVLLLALFSSSLVFAAGEPMNEDFSALITLSEKMIQAGHQADSTGFVAAAEEASTVVKEKGMNGNSPKLQKVAPRFKAAKKAVNDGDFDKAVKLVEEALALMKK